MVIADSSAVLLQGRVLTQHQAALALIRQLTQDPKIARVNWLDLACGRGQILSNVERVIPPNRRGKITYLGFDVSSEHAMQAENRARALFAEARVQICELKYFENYLEDDELFDIVTITNSVHEISPSSLAETLVAAFCRISEQGCLFVYDMELLPEPELGAIPWTGKEMERIVHQMLLVAGVHADALPDVAVWPHKNCTCWNLQMHRAHLQVEDLKSHRLEMTQVVTSAIQEALEEKLLSVHTALDSASRYGPETMGENKDIIRLLYDHWAISRSLGRPVALALQGLGVKNV